MPENYKEHFRSKVVLITGGLGGIGLATAKRFMEHGATVVLTDIKDPDEDPELKMKIRLKGLVHFMLADGREQTEVTHAVAQVLKDHKRIDVLFNNMGVGANLGEKVMQKAEDIKQEDAENVMKINYLSHTYFTAAVLPHMRKRGNGAILFSSSTWANNGRVGATAYSGAKSALSDYARTVHNENQQNDVWKGIRVHAIEWPAVDTPLGRGKKDGLPDPLTTSEAANSVVAAAAGHWENGKTVTFTLLSEFDIVCRHG